MNSDATDVSDSLQGASPRVLAIIVAYDAPDVLRRCLADLDALVRPVDGVLVIDNGDSIPVNVSGLELSIVDRVRVLRSGSNLGPAGGFALGLGVFMEELEWTHAWLMDDDTFPEPGSLGGLLEGVHRVRPGVLAFPSALNEETASESRYPGWGHAPLLDRLAVTLTGLPRAELFWWIEDTEYLQYRAPSRGVLVTHVRDAHIRFVLARRSETRPTWKFYYETRNTIWYRIHVQKSGAEGIAKLSRSVARLTGAAVLEGFKSGSWTRLRFVFRGVWDGFRGRLGRPIVPVP